MSRSLVTLAMMLAAPMEMLFASPFIMGTCRIFTPGMVTASFKSKSGGVTQFSDGLPHGLVGGLKDVDLINPFGGCHSDSHSHCLIHNHIVEFFPLRSGQFLRIVDIEDVAVFRQNDSRSHHRSRQGTSPHFIIPQMR